MEESSTTKDDHAATAAIWRHPSYMQVVSTLRYVTPSSPLFHSYLSRHDYSLILQMHATFAYFSVCSGLSLMLRIFSQMRLCRISLLSHQSSYFHRHWMYIFCGLTLAGKASNKWVSPQATLEVNQGTRHLKKENPCTMYEGGVNHLSRCTVSIVSKCPFYVHAILSRPGLSFVKKIK